MSGPPAIVLIPLSRLHPAPWNPRLIQDARFRSLCQSLQSDPDFLWRRPILAQTSGEIMAGNMRFRAAEHLGWTAIPAILEDIPAQLAKERSIRDNNQWGEWQDDELAALIYELGASGADLEVLGFDDRDIDRLLASVSDARYTPEYRPALRIPLYDEGDMAGAKARLEAQQDGGHQRSLVTITCPHCSGTFAIEPF